MPDEPKPTPDSSENAPPVRRKNRDADRIREDARKDGGGDAPMDPADEKFIDSK